MTLEELDARLDALHERLDAVGGWFVGAVERMDNRLRVIEQQNERTAEMLQVLGHIHP